VIPIDPEFLHTNTPRLATTLTIARAVAQKHFLQIFQSLGKISEEFNRDLAFVAARAQYSRQCHPLLPRRTHSAQARPANRQLNLPEFPA
jgi:hypothetical protein